MPASRIQSLDLVINGVLDPGVQRMIQTVEQGLKNMGASARTTSAALKSVYGVAFAPPAEIQKTIDKMGALQDKFKGLGTVISGVGIGNLLSEGIQVGIEKAQELGAAIGNAVQKAGEFTRTREQLAIELGKGQGDPYTEQIIEQLQKYSFQTHLVPDALLEAFRQTKSSGFTDTEAFTRIQQIANISAATVPHGENASEAFLQLMDVFNKAAKGGAALERTMYMFEKRGVALRGIMARMVGMDVPADIVNLDPDDPRAAAIDTELAKRIKARKVPFSAIGGAVEQLGGPGGKYDVMAQFSKDLLGAESTLQGSLAMFQREIGHAFEGPLTQIINKINEYFDWSKFKQTQDFLDGFAAKTNAAFKPLLDIVSKGDWTKVGASFVGLIDELGKVFEKSQPMLEAWAKDLPGELNTLLQIGKAIEGIAVAIEKAFKWAENLIPKATPTPAGTTYDSLGNAITTHADAVNKGADAMHNLNKAVDKVSGNDLQHMAIAVDLVTEKLLRLAYGGGGSGAGGLSDRPGETFYEHPDTEGSNSQYGPKGNALGYGYGVGLGPADRVGHPLGSWVKVRTPNGRTLWRQVNEHATRGIEFVTPSTDESSYGEGKSEIIDSSPTKPAGAQIIFNISAWDTAGLDRILHEHGDRFLSHLNRLQGEDHERHAVI